MAGLTPKQEKFCQSVAHKEFDFIWEAYAAHYSASKMSQNSIYVEACKLIQNPKISLRIQEIEKEIVSKSQKTLDDILTAMSRRLDINIKAFHNEDGSYKNVHELTDDEAMCINEFNTEEIWAGKGADRAQIGRIVKVKLIDIKSLWDMFMKKFGAYITKHTHEVEDLQDIQDIVERIEKLK
nr:terminase small subunit [uncultured Draconibacterium sp.]